MPPALSEASYRSVKAGNLRVGHSIHGGGAVTSVDRIPGSLKGEQVRVRLAGGETKTYGPEDRVSVTSADPVTEAVELAVQESLRDAAASRLRWIRWEQRHGAYEPKGSVRSIEPRHLQELPHGAKLRLPDGTEVHRKGDKFDVHMPDPQGGFDVMKDRSAQSAAKQAQAMFKEHKASTPKTLEKASATTSTGREIGMSKIQLGGKQLIVGHDGKVIAPTTGLDNHPGILPHAGGKGHYVEHMLPKDTMVKGGKVHLKGEPGWKSEAQVSGKAKYEKLSNGNHVVHMPNGETINHGPGDSGRASAKEQIAAHERSQAKRAERASSRSGGFDHKAELAKASELKPGEPPLPYGAKYDLQDAKSAKTPEDARKSIARAISGMPLSHPMGDRLSELHNKLDKSIQDKLPDLKVGDTVKVAPGAPEKHVAGQTRTVSTTWTKGGIRGEYHEHVRLDNGTVVHKSHLTKVAPESNRSGAAVNKDQAEAAGRAGKAAGAPKSKLAAASAPKSEGPDPRAWKVSKTHHIDRDPNNKFKVRDWKRDSETSPWKVGPSRTPTQSETAALVPRYKGSEPGGSTSASGSTTVGTGGPASGTVHRPLRQIANGKGDSLSQKRKQDLVNRGYAKWDGPGKVSLTDKGKAKIQEAELEQQDAVEEAVRELLEGKLSDAVKRPGQLHRDLGVPEDQKIPVAKIRDAAKNHKDPKVRKRAQLALTFKKVNEAEAVSRDDLALMEAADSMVKASTPEPFSRSRTSNWVAKVGGLPAYIQHIAHDLMEKRGKSESNAIQMAIGIVKRWARGGGNVDANTRAAAAKAVAEWEAKKAAAHAQAAAWDDRNLPMELAILEAMWNEDDPAVIAEAERLERDSELRAKLLLEADTAPDVNTGPGERSDGLKVKCPECNHRTVPKSGKCANCGHDVSKLAAFAKRLKGKSKVSEAEDDDPVRRAVREGLDQVLS